MENCEFSRRERRFRGFRLKPRRGPARTGFAVRRQGNLMSVFVPQLPVRPALGGLPTGSRSDSRGAERTAADKYGTAQTPLVETCRDAYIANRRRGSKGAVTEGAACFFLMRVNRAFALNGLRRRDLFRIARRGGGTNGTGGAGRVFGSRSSLPAGSDCSELLWRMF